MSTIFFRSSRRYRTSLARKENRHTARSGIIFAASPPSVLCYKLAFSLAASFSDLFGISQLTGLMKCAEGVSSIITAMLVSFLLMAVISISLMIFMAGVAV